MNRKPFDEEDRRIWKMRVEKAMKQAREMGWDYVIERLAPPLQNVIAKAGKHTYCPNPRHTHQRNGDAMRTFRDDFVETGGMICNTCGSFGSGVDVLIWWHGWSFGETIKQLESLFGGSVPVRSAAAAHTPSSNAKSASQQMKEDEATAGKLAKVWGGAIALDSPDAVVARTYLQNRGIDTHLGSMPDVRFHPALPYYEAGKETGRWPAIVYVVRTADGKPGTLQRLWLARDGSWKAPLDPPKKMMTRRSDRILTGGACRLDHAVHHVLNVAEGFETALSVRLLTGLPTWCCASGELLRGFQPPADVEFLAVWGDFDASGMRCADRLVERVRAEGKRAVAIYPTYPLGSRTKYDWNDALVEIGIATIRQQSFYRSFFAGLKEKLAAKGLDLRTGHGA